MVSYRTSQLNDFVAAVCKCTVYLTMPGGNICRRMRRLFALQRKGDTLVTVLGDDKCWGGTINMSHRQTHGILHTTCISSTNAEPLESTSQALSSTTQEHHKRTNLYSKLVVKPHPATSQSALFITPYVSYCMQHTTWNICYLTKTV